jgi:hypothetical protein
MKGILAPRDELADPIEAAPRAGKLERCMRHQPVRADPGNEGKIQGFILSVVGNVEKGVREVRNVRGSASER